MDNVLRLFIDPGWPHTHTDCVWMLCDRANMVIRRGRGEPRDWPGMAQRHATNNYGQGDEGKSTQEPLHCDLIFVGDQAACLNVQLPKSPAGLRPEVLTTAIEPLLLEPVSSCLFHVLHQNESGVAAVAVINRQRLTSVVEFVRQLGLDPQSAWGEGMLLRQDNKPSKQDGQRQQRNARLSDGQLLMPVGEAGFASVPCHGKPDESDGEAATCSTNWLREVAAQGIPRPLRINYPDNEKPEAYDFKSLAAALQTSLQVAKESYHTFPLLEPPAGGFLYGELLLPARQSSLWHFLRPSAWLAAAICGLLCAMLLTQWGWLAWQAEGKRQEMRELFRQSFPQAALVNPTLQMQRLLDDRRRQLGRLGEADFLALLSHAVHANTPHIDTLEYSNGLLSITLSGAPDELHAWHERMVARGLSVNRNSLPGRGNATFVIGPKG